jgi:wyosine [tRNA(Phe)-imidazoG37] synthetase (radical SAM superfamily)
MMREEIVFGPIHSRRLGSSLGINILPERGKLCNFDCIYCECGWNCEGRGDRHLPSPDDLRLALETKLSACSREGIGIDSITFSGDGEPTINPGFPGMIDITLELRDKYYPKALVSVLSNATMIHIDSVFEALRKVDNPILKIDAPTTELARIINRPAPGYRVEDVVEAMKRFEGNFVLQTMFLHCEGFDSSSPEVLEGWMDIVRTVKPREVMVYTIDRETPQKDLQKFTVEEMRSLVEPLVEEGFKVQVRG